MGKCADTDVGLSNKGINPYEEGTASSKKYFDYSQGGVVSSEKIFNIDDFCCASSTSCMVGEKLEEGKYVNEAYCDEEGIIRFKSFKCAYRCIDNACTLRGGCSDLILEIEDVSYSNGETSIGIRRGKGIEEVNLEKIKIVINGNELFSEIDIPSELNTKNYIISSEQPTRVDIQGVINVLEESLSCSISDTFEL